MHLNLNHNAERTNADHDEPELFRVLVEGEATQLTVGVDKPKARDRTREAGETNTCAVG
ncbi:hypothetical protein QP986_04470 [Corynebacterium striatum]|uniref:hypothetical protein n=1 Tax=Corynebacterium striatum TaxID=43770 RepID=UPI001CB75DB7|nr:hypothetical protein [Corynebacterium striatum]MDK8843327.1 hypothetical protein [Corynebacterium striatum]